MNTEQEIKRLRTLQESYDALADGSGKTAEAVAELHDKVKEEVKTEYQYAFVQNADDMDTYTMILPTSAVVDDETINL